MQPLREQEEERDSHQGARRKRVERRRLIVEALHLVEQGPHAGYEQQRGQGRSDGGSDDLAHPVVGIRAGRGGSARVLVVAVVAVVILVVLRLNHHRLDVVALPVLEIVEAILELGRRVVGEDHVGPSRAGAYPELAHPALLVELQVRPGAHGHDAAGGHLGRAGVPPQGLGRLLGMLNAVLVGAFGGQDQQLHLAGGVRAAGAPRAGPGVGAVGAQREHPYPRPPASVRVVVVVVVVGGGGHQGREWPSHKYGEEQHGRPGRHRRYQPGRRRAKGSLETGNAAEP
mmetsp:Transcript_3346/g.9031  ORF Transcript_3346/g.9031 Transcript_3346/m.9031 type:complete len:286 (-) Transcript_3346:3-860(-)